MQDDLHHTRERKIPLGLRRTLLWTGGVLSSTLLTSCFTLMLWGADLDLSEEDPALFTFENADVGWGNVGYRVLWTPLVLALDCATMPVQFLGLGLWSCLNDDEDDEDWETDSWRHPEDIPVRRD